MNSNYRQLSILARERKTHSDSLRPSLVFFSIICSKATTTATRCHSRARGVDEEGVHGSMDIVEDEELGLGLEALDALEESLVGQHAGRVGLHQSRQHRRYHLTHTTAHRRQTHTGKVCPLTQCLPQRPLAPAK